MTSLGILCILEVVAVASLTFAVPANASSRSNLDQPSARCLMSGPSERPVGTGTCPGVRPGAVVISEHGSCTLNFLFKGSDRRTYIGTAGHCILARGEPEQVWPETSGPVASDSGEERFGEFAYAIFDGPHDFALIRVDRGVKTDPQMCYWGGPTGINKDLEAELITARFFGQGVGMGRAREIEKNTLPARSAVALGTENPDHVYATGPAIFGDSGAAVISSDGRAVGDLVTGGISLANRPSDIGSIGISRLMPNVKQAQEALGLKLKLQTAKLISP